MRLKSTKNSKKSTNKLNFSTPGQFYTHMPPWEYESHLGNFQGFEQELSVFNSNFANVSLWDLINDKLDGIPINIRPHIHFYLSIV